MQDVAEAFAGGNVAVVHPHYTCRQDPKHPHSFSFNARLKKNTQWGQNLSQYCKQIRELKLSRHAGELRSRAAVPLWPSDG